MELPIGTFILDHLSLLFSAFGHTICWMRGDRELIVDRPDGSSWHWRKEFGRWTARGGDILDGCRAGRPKETQGGTVDGH
jgi:hypothetical protein